MKLLWKIIIGVICVITIKYCNCYRLPLSVKPHKYDIEIITYLDESGPYNFYFTGKSKIELECHESTKKIIMHSKDLRINHNQTHLNKKGHRDKVINIIDVEIDSNKDFYILHLEQPLEAKQFYKLVIEYEGKLIDGLAGYYRSNYVDDAKKKHWLAVTQFEPTDARRAFPCFDEPSFKSRFKISLGRREHLTSISNMPLNRTENIIGMEGWQWDRYQESVPMSTYLVAFIVSDFSYKTSDRNMLNNVTFNIWARTNALNQVNFAKDVGPRALHFFEKYFDIPYPLPKQDMVAIPDFSAGAMENWGLITYRETALLIDPNVATVPNMHRVASTISHELAHQWFGNLVTMKWWTDLWLNEGFATYMASIAVDHLFPQWNSLNDEAYQNLNRVFETDSLVTSHPVSVPISNPNEISQIFDAISYKKGSLLIRMMYLYLGKRTLQSGISNYLKANEFRNAEQDDLWHQLTVEAHKNHVLEPNQTVKLIMDTWTLQTGYPLVHILRNYDNGCMEITQERYFSDIKQYNNTKNDQCWWIPLSYTTEIEKNFNSTMAKLWMTCPKQKQIVCNLPSDKWVLFNIQASGIYRTNYDTRNWKMLSADLNRATGTTIPEMSRVLLIENAMTFASIGKLKYDIAFDLISYINYDTKYLPWKTALGKLSDIARALKRTANYQYIKSFVHNLVKPVYSKLGGLDVAEEKRNSLDAVKYQVLIASTSCKYNVKECVHQATELFKKWRSKPNEPNPISKDMRSVVYCNGIRYGSEEDWDFLWDKYKESNIGSERSSILAALGCSRDVWILSRYLEWSLRNNSEIRTQDSGTVFNGVIKNHVGYFVAKTFFETHITEIYNRLQPKTNRMGSFIIDIAEQIHNEYEQMKFQTFLNHNNHYFEKCQLQLKQAIEIMEINVQWHNNHYGEIEQVLNNKKME